MTDSNNQTITPELLEYIAVLKRKEAELSRQSTEKWESACRAQEGDEKDRLFEEQFEALIGEVVHRQVRENLVRSIIEGEGQSS